MLVDLLRVILIITLVFIGVPCQTHTGVLLCGVDKCAGQFPKSGAKHPGSVAE